MPIADLQRRLTEVGRIRLGYYDPKGKGKPVKLETFRFTSSAKHLIDEIAQLYGGDVKPWQTSRGPQHEVITTASQVPVYLPPQKVDPFYELWGKGGVCLRRCDGIRETIRDIDCPCEPNKRDCKPTTRINLLLADVPGLGVWRLETHGIYAAMELSQLAELLSRVPMPIPARLMLQQRSRRHYDRGEDKVVVKDYRVPVLLIDAVTARHLHYGGDAINQALGAAAAPAAIEAAAEPVLASEQVAKALALISSAATVEELQPLWERIEATGSHPQLVAAWRQRRQHIGTQPAQEPAAEDDPADRQQAWTGLLSTAAARKMDTAALDMWLAEHEWPERRKLTAAQMRDVADHLKTGGTGSE